MLSVQRIIPAAAVEPIRRKFSALPGDLWLARQVAQLQIGISHHQACKSKGDQ